MALYTLPTSIPKRAKGCTLCHVPFKIGEELISTLASETRSDYCLSCWKGEEGGSAWRVKVLKTKKEKGERFLDLFERGLALLRRYLDEGDSKAYTLALYLQRQGALQKLKALRTKEPKVLFEVIETGETLAIPVADPTPPGPLEKELMAALTDGL
ncbi:MAG: hypothetical protein AB7F31_01785 [Parachlamydiales bacterium]